MNIYILLVEVQKYCTVSRPLWNLCVWSGYVEVCNTTDLFKGCLKMIIWCGSSIVMAVGEVLVLRVSPAHGNYIISADTPLNSNSKHCLFHFQQVTVDAVLVMCVSPARGNYTKALHSIAITNTVLFHFQWVAVDAAVFVCVSNKWQYADTPFNQ